MPRTSRLNGRDPEDQAGGPVQAKGLPRRRLQDLTRPRHLKERIDTRHAVNTLVDKKPNECLLNIMHSRQKPRLGKE